MNIKTQLRVCVIANGTLLLIVMGFIVALADNDSKYWGFGPSSKLYIVSVKVDSWAKYVLLLLLVGMMDVVDVLVNELGMPILSFRVYDPDKRIITEFSKNELQLYANTMFTINGLRSTLTMVISISQIDLAVFRVLLAQLVSIITVRMILNKKTFTTDIESRECLLVSEVESSL